MTQPRTVTLCCNGPRCPVVTEIGSGRYSVVDDYNASAEVTAEDLATLARMGSSSNSASATIKFKNVTMRADQAALATSILNQC